MSLRVVEEKTGLLDAAFEIAARRADTEREMKEALLEGNDQKALSLLRKHLGVDEKNDRTIKSKYGRAGRRGSRLYPVAANDQP